MGNETGETPTPPPFPLGHRARHLKRAKIPWPSFARTGIPAFPTVPRLREKCSNKLKGWTQGNESSYFCASNSEGVDAPRLLRSPSLHFNRTVTQIRGRYRHRWGSHSLGPQ